MPATKSQVLIRHKRRRTGVLVPLLEDLFQKPVEIDSKEDVEWITSVLERMVERQHNRNFKPVFSPSQLSECLRYVYLLKHWRELDIKKQGVVRLEPNYYFFNGNWLHLKWQFALYKLDKYVDDPKVFKLHGVEIPILSKHRDHGGTADAICSIYEKPYIPDFKGLNVRTFGEITRGYVPEQYAVQLADYGMLYNSQRKNGSKIFNGLLVSENKGGPDSRHPIALHETEIPIKTHLPEVRSRLETLRKHEKANSIPKPECESTGSYQFQGCPFRGYCRKEVQKIEAKKRKADRSDTAQLEVARPSGSRNHRAGRNSK